MSTAAVKEFPKLRPAKVAAPIVGATPLTLGSAAWRRRHNVPHFKIGRRVLFDLAELRRWAEERRA